MTLPDIARLQEEAAAAQAEYREVFVRCNEEIAAASAKADVAFFRLQRAKENLGKETKR